MKEHTSDQAAQDPPAEHRQPDDLVINVGKDVGSVYASPYYPPPEDRIKVRQESTRSTIALTFVGVFALTIVLAFIVVIGFNSDWAATKDLLQLIIPAETALIGSAIGFYFGTQTEKSK